MGTRSPVAIAALLVFVGLVPAAAEDVARANVSVHVDVSARTSLKVSSELLRFDVARPGTPAVAVVDFLAGSRLPSGSDIVLTVEAIRGIDGPGGAADVETAVDFEGAGESGTLSTAGAAILGRWHGSGLRQGRLVFTLHASAAGSYSLPVRFVLSTP